MDVALQLREPRNVSVIANRVDSATATACQYLKWFTSVGPVRESAGRPVRYEQNDSVLWWRRAERIRGEYSDPEVGDELEAAVEELLKYRERYDADSPDKLSLVDLSCEMMSIPFVAFETHNRIHGREIARLEPVMKN